MIHTVAIEVLVSMQGHFLHFSSIELCKKLLAGGREDIKIFTPKNKEKLRG